MGAGGNVSTLKVHRSHVGNCKREGTSKDAPSQLSLKAPLNLEVNDLLMFSAKNSFGTVTKVLF